MLDLTSWMVSGAAPAAIAALACGIAIGLRVRSDRNDSSASTGRRDLLARIAISLGWAAAVTAGLAGQRWAGGEAAFEFWPEDFWQRGYLAVGVVALFMGATAGVRLKDLPIRWVMAGLCAVGTAAISLPTGEGWEDMLPLHQGWAALVAGSCLLGFWSLDRLSAASTDRWFPLVILATLAGPLTVAASTYMGLAQWTIAAVAATLPIALLALAGWIDARIAVGVAYPAVTFATAMSAAGRFFSYEDHPWWSYLGILLVPLAIALVDLPLRGRHGAIRAAVAAVTALAAIGATALLQYAPSDSGGGEW